MEELFKKVEKKASETADEKLRKYR